MSHKVYVHNVAYLTPIPFRPLSLSFVSIHYKFSRYFYGLYASFPQNYFILHIPTELSSNLFRSYYYLLLSSIVIPHFLSLTAPFCFFSFLLLYFLANPIIQPNNNFPYSTRNILCHWNIYTP